MWARRIRQKYFELAREKFKCDFIFTAHHLNDKVETMIMNLDKGCSIEGLRGIPKQNNFILRPLLNFKRKDIELYIDKNNLPFVDDLSNYDTLIKRNLVRHKVLKPWEKQSSNLLLKLNKISIDAASAVERMNSFIELFSKSFKTEDNCILIRDEQIAFPAAGAYQLAMESNYNLSLKPAVIMVEDGKAYVIRRRETYDDLTNLDVTNQLGPLISPIDSR